MPYRQYCSEVSSNVPISNGFRFPQALGNQVSFQLRPGHLDSLPGLIRLPFSLILLHQTIPLLILCLDIIESHERGGIEEDLAMVAWVSDFVESTAVKRVELRPAKTLMKALTLVCQQAKSGGQ